MRASPAPRSGPGPEGLRGDAGPDPLLLGLRALAREEIELARSLLAEAVAARPDDADAHAFLGCALLAAGVVPDGIDAIGRAVALAPDGFASNLKAGELSLRLGDPRSAEANFLKALRAAAPASPDAAAARVLLTEARRRSRASIPHEAFLPPRRLPNWLGGRRRVPAEAPPATEAKGAIG